MFKGICFLLFIGLLSLKVSCQTSCKTLPARFNSYNEAISKIKSSDFLLVEKIDASGSSWIEKLLYYSCDGRKGFLIMGAKGREYVHAMVPLLLWESFKKASSKGTFYNINLRNRYQLYLQ